MYVEPAWTGQYLALVEIIRKTDQIHHGRLAHQIASAAQAAGGHRRHPDLGARMHIGGFKHRSGGSGGCDPGLAEYCRRKQYDETCSCESSRHCTVLSFELSFDARGRLPSASRNVPTSTTTPGLVFIQERRVLALCVPLKSGVE